MRKPPTLDVTPARLSASVLTHPSRPPCPEREPSKGGEAGGRPQEVTEAGAGGGGSVPGGSCLGGPGSPKQAPKPEGARGVAIGSKEITIDMQAQGDRPTAGCFSPRGRRLYKLCAGWGSSPPQPREQPCARGERRGASGERPSKSSAILLSLVRRRFVDLLLLFFASLLASSPLSSRRGRARGRRA